MRKVAVAAFAVLFVLLITLSILSVSAYDITKSDFKQPPNATLVINGKIYKPYIKNGNLTIDTACTGGESVKLTYYVEPSSTTSAKKEVSRTYTARSDLLNPDISAVIEYRNGGGTSIENKPKTNYLDIDVGSWDQGLGEIILTVTGKVPTINNRVEYLKVLYIDVQGGAPNCLPNVTLLVINPPKFQSDLNNLIKEYDTLNNEMGQYIGKVDTSTLSNYLKAASNNLTSAKTLFNSKDYVKANDHLESAIKWLKKAKNELSRVEAEYLVTTLSNKLNNIETTITKIGVYLDQIESKNLVSVNTLLNYKTMYQNLQNKYTEVKTELSAANAYLSSGDYKDAITKAKKAESDVGTLESSANTLLTQLENVLNPSSTTPTATSTSSNIGFNFKLNNYAIIGGIVVVVIIIAALLYMKGGGGFDELR